MLSFKAQFSINKKFTELRSVKRALKINALEIQGVARTLVNVDTARLQSSIDIYVYPSGKTIEIGSSVEYAAPQESIKSYLEEALKQQKETLKRDISKAIINTSS